MKKNITALFVTKNDAEAFASNAKKNTAPNDWLLTGTKKEKTFLNVGRMVALLSKDIEKEADKYGFAVYDMSKDFQDQLLKVLNDLVRN